MPSQEPETASKDIISEERLNKAIHLYEEISDMDNSCLKRRLYNTLMKKRAIRRRKITLAIYSAAVLLPLVIITGSRFLTDIRMNINTQSEARSFEHVLLTLSDGSKITLGSMVGDTTLIEGERALFNIIDGTLIVDKKEGGEEHEGKGTNTIYVPKGMQYIMVLEDSTRVWLNSDSKMIFPSVFNDKERRLKIDGELYFQVRANASKPFIVEAGSQILTVLGTEFNISAYSTDRVILTTLISGKVSVTDENGMEAILNPNEQSEYDLISKSFTVREVNAAGIAAWKEGYFVFDENTLEQALQKMSRWYDIAFSFDDDDLKGILYKGTLPKYDDITKVLNYIEKSGDVRLDFKENHVTVSKK